MFDRALFEQWLAALRSGKYQQCRTALHKDNRFCCLGVACDVYGVTWVDMNWRSMFCIDSDDGLDSYLIIPPDYIQDAIGINIKVNGTPIQEYLFALNDSGFSFRFIASVAGYMVEQTQRELGNV